MSATVFAQKGSETYGNTLVSKEHLKNFDGKVVENSGCDDLPKGNTISVDDVADFGPPLAALDVALKLLIDKSHLLEFVSSCPEFGASKVESY